MWPSARRQENDLER
jgi:hypothetical protein